MKCGKIGEAIVQVQGERLGMIEERVHHEQPTRRDGRGLHVIHAVFIALSPSPPTIVLLLEILLLEAITAICKSYLVPQFVSMRLIGLTNTVPPVTGPDTETIRRRWRSRIFRFSRTFRLLLLFIRTGA